MLPRESRTRPNAPRSPKARAATDLSAARAKRTDAITAYIRSLGYKGTITSAQRRLAAEAIEFAQQVASMSAAA